MNLFSFYSILSVLGRGNYQLSIINYQFFKGFIVIPITYLIKHLIHFEGLAFLQQLGQPSISC